MNSHGVKFKLFDRGFKETILLIPGWATDYRIFEPLDIKFNYLLPVVFSTKDFNTALLSAFSRNGLDKIFILGWSLGAFLAADFAGKYPQRVSRNIIMVSAKEQYQKDAIERIKAYLRKNRRGYLYKFYQECFCEEEKDAFYWFKRRLLKNYLNNFDLDSLLCGLDYLVAAKLNLKQLEQSKVIFIHGCKDKVAPAKEIFKIEKAGHIPFLNPNFRGIFYEALH